jgi:hypothetical protein
MTPARGDWRWTPQLYKRRRVDRVPFKTLAFEFDRSQATVSKRYYEMEEWLEREFRPILEQHRKEELELLDKLLEESRGRRTRRNERQ